MGKYASVYFSPRRGTKDVVVGFIDLCETEILAAVYAITHDEITAALIRAHQRGVTVRILTDKLMASGRYSDDEELEAAGIALRRDTQSGAMHHKFMLGDGTAVATGSFNWTANADQRNAENWTVVRLKYLVEEFRQEFERMWDLNAPEPPSVAITLEV